MNINQKDLVEPGPRIGDEFQVEVPELMRSDNYVSYNQRVGLRIGEESFSSLENDAELDCNNNSCIPSCFPRANKWKDIECRSFLLGLYSFGKKLPLVKKFVETKSMSDVLNYYYGKFYGTEEYVRWSQCRKEDISKIAMQENLYTGWRQHELLSRISPHVPSDHKKLLAKVMHQNFIRFHSFEKQDAQFDFAHKNYRYVIYALRDTYLSSTTNLISRIIFVLQNLCKIVS